MKAELIKKMAEDAGAETLAVFGAPLSMDEATILKFAQALLAQCRGLCLSVSREADANCVGENMADGQAAEYAYVSGFQSAAVECDDAIRAHFGL